MPAFVNGKSPVISIPVGCIVHFAVILSPLSYDRYYLF